MTRERANGNVSPLPMNNKIRHQGRKVHSRGRAWWVVGILMAGMMVLASLLFVMTSGIAFAATWGPTSITDTNDDGYEEEGYAWYANDQPYIYNFIGYDQDQLNIGLRFTNITIPQGATINSATIEVYQRYYDVSGAPTGQWQAWNTDNAGQFGGATRPSTVPLTTAYVTHNPTTGEGWKSASIGSVIQEIIDRPGWTSGNAINLVWMSTNTGCCHWQDFYDVRQGSNTARLTIDYTPPAQAVTYSNTNSINIPLVGSATPYPSTITVPSLSGTVTKVTVTINGLTHTYPDDVRILLVGPQGENVLLMYNQGAGDDVTGVNLTFDDSAASQLPDSQIISGTYKPCSDTQNDDMNPPAPARPYGTTLSVFNGIDPQGDWSLYVLDWVDNDSGSISGGWELTLTGVTESGQIGALLVTSINNHGNLSSYSFPSATYSNDVLYIAFTTTSCSSADGCSQGIAPAATSVSGAGLTFTEIGAAGGLLFSGTTRRIQAWRALVPSGATTGVVTVTLEYMSTSMGAAMLAFTGTKTSGTNGADAVVQYNTNTSSGTGLTVTLNAFADSNNRPVAFFAHRYNEATTPEAGYTELWDATNATTPVMGYEAEWHATMAETTPSVSGWTTGYDNGGFALEIAADTGPATGGTKIVVAGTADWDFGVVRYNSDGSLDTTFDSDGMVTTEISGNDQGYAVAIQDDGKIVVAGYSGNTDFAVVRYNTDGSLDTVTFNPTGAFGGPPNSPGMVTTVIGDYDYGYAVAIQSDGKIVVAGTVSSGGQNTFAVVRYNSDGSLDTTFDGDGIVVTIFGAGTDDQARAVAIQPDGKIVVAGSSDADFAVARYNSDGSLDNTFNGDGRVTTDFGSSDYGYAVTIQPDGKIVVAGKSNNNFALARYNSSGTLDSTFDSDGMVTTLVGTGIDEAQGVGLQSDGVGLQSDGKIVAAGRAYVSTTYDFGAASYNSNGSPDSTFDSDGIVTTHFGGTSGDDAYAVAIQSDGKIIAAGTSNVGGNYDVAVVRYNSDGSLDTSFDSDGMVTTPVSASGTDNARGIALVTESLPSNINQIHYRWRNDDGEESGSETVTIDGTPSTGTAVSPATSMTISHTISASATDRLMLVGVSIANGNDEVVDSITYNGVALDFVGAIYNTLSGGNDARVEIWSLVAPSTGTHDVFIQFTAQLSEEAVAGVMTFTGVDQSDPLGPFGSNENDGNTATVNVTSDANELVFGVVSSEYGEITTDPGQTEEWNIGVASHSYGAGSTKAGASSVTLTWTLSSSSSHWAAAGVSIKPASGSGATFMEAEDIAISGLDKSTTARLRLEVSNEGTDSSGSIQYRLQYKESTTGDWTNVPDSATGGEHWQMSHSDYINDTGEPTSDIDPGLTNPGGGTFVQGELRDNTAVTSGITLATTEFTEIEYSIEATPNATDGQTYYFRVTRSDGTTDNFTYPALLADYPKVTLAGVLNSAPSAPTTPYCDNTTAQSGQPSPATGITDPSPAFSAIYEDPDLGDIANKYRVEVNTQSNFAGTAMWDSGASGTTMADTNRGSRCPDIIYAGSALQDSTTYYWRITFWDDDGAEGAVSATQQFTTTTLVNEAPSAPTTPYSNNTTAQSGQTNPTNITDPSPAFSAIYEDNPGDTANKYRVEVNTQSDFNGTIMWDSGASGTTMADTTEGSRCPDIIYAGSALQDSTTYYWRITFWDDDGAEGTVSATQEFTITAVDNYSYRKPISPATMISGPRGTPGMWYIPMVMTLPSGPRTASPSSTMRWKNMFPRQGNWSPG